MAAASPSTETDICNMALGRIGADRLGSTDLDDNTKVNAIHCNLHYAQVRDSLLRSHWWRFAGARAELSTTTTPDFEWSYAYSLPDDFLSFRSIYEDNNTPLHNTVDSFKFEGNVLMSDESSMEIRYTKQVTAVSDFDPLFIEVFVLRLAMKLVSPIAGAGSAAVRLYESLKDDLKLIMPKVRALDRQEQNNARRTSFNTWNNARASNQGRLDSQMGSA
jgi:hypothetical protein